MFRLKVSIWISERIHDYAEHASIILVSIYALASILQLIGLIRKNRFFIIPSIICIFLRVTVLSVLVCFSLYNHGWSSIEYFEFYMFVAYIIINYYYIGLSIYWYRKLSEIYNLEIHTTRFGESALNYASLEEDERAQNKNNHAQKSEVHELDNILLASVVAVD